MARRADKETMVMETISITLEVALEPTHNKVKTIQVEATATTTARETMEWSIDRVVATKTTTAEEEEAL